VKFGVNSNTNNLQPDNGAQMLADLGYTLAGSSPTGALAMTLASGANYLLSMEIEALQNEGRGEQLSNPRVLTSDRQLAHIEQGIAIPYTVAQSANSPATTEYVDATLAMDVTPQITPTGSIIMDVMVKKDSPTPENFSQSQGGEAPGIDKRNVETRVQVEDGQTVVLGGIYESNVGNSKESVPWFGDLPLFGWLFTPQKSVFDNKAELLIFVTPKVVKDGSIGAVH
jgi:type IV pilus assembly protein PilQ